MAGARPSQYKRGGNRIFTGDATILDYTINDEFNGKPYDPKEKNAQGKPRFHWLYVHLTARFDGADAPSEKTFSIAAASDWTVDKGGKTIVPNSDDQALGASAGWQVLMDSLIAAGFDETLLSETEVNYEPIIGARVRFGSRKNERLAKEGKKQLNKKTGKSYDYEDIVVEQFYGFEAAAKTKANGAVKANGKAGNGVDIDALAEETLLTILAGKDGSAKKSSLSLAVLQALTAHPHREDVRKKLGDDAYLASLASVRYDKQTGMVAVA